MIISIASGKGGTGKTTVATNLAWSLSEPVMLADCDVEEPNAHLFLQPEISSSSTEYMPVPEIDMEKCTACRKCMDICRFRAITVVRDVVLTFPELCHGCGGCLAVCPEGAVREVGRELGVVERGTRDHIDFLHGRLRVGEAMSPPLIHKVRIAAEKSGTITILDAPPGTSCPAIAAMNNVDAVVMVTEPTPFGLHDLKLAVEAVKLLDIPRGLVINRCDVGDRAVWEYAEQEDLPILMEIPFDRRIAEAYSRGELMARAVPEWKERFQKLYADIEKLAGGKVAPR